MAILNGTSGSDEITGTTSGDTIDGLGGNDILAGGSGDDTLIGGDGNDTLIGGANEDELRGGAGADTFRYVSRGFGTDTIVDFNRAEGDRIDLAYLNIGDYDSLAPFITQSGLDTVITLRWGGNSEKIILKNVDKESLGASDFVFRTADTPLTVNGPDGFYHDFLFGGRGDDTVNGGSGDDTLVGGAGKDTLIGGANEDELHGGAGADTFRYISRGFGTDTIVDFSRAQGDRIDLAYLNIGDYDSLKPFITQNGLDAVITLGWGGNSEKIILKNVDKSSLSASDFVFRTADTALTVNGPDGYCHDFLFGGRGDDTINGGSGDDTLVGGAGNDMLHGGTGSDRHFGGTGSDTVTYFGTSDAVTVNLATGVGSGGEAQGDSYTSIENVYGGLGDDVMAGSAGANILKGYDGDDRLSGGDGNDTLNGGAGADGLNGGAGFDLVTYFDSTKGVAVNLYAGTGSGGTATGDRLASIEAVNGSAYADTLIGGSVANTLSGGAGNDTLRGGAGSDTLDGGAGTDLVSYADSTKGVTVDLTTGTASGGTATGDRLVSIEAVNGSGYADTLIGSSAADTLRGSTGDDALRGGAGADRLDGGAGIDTASYYGGKTGVTVDLTAGTGKNGEAEGDTLTGIENVSGSLGNDWLIGNTGANVLKGWNGDDTLWGAQGKDILTGGAGADTFFYYAASESAVGRANADQITDFNHTQGDRIDLSQIDADGSGGAGNGTFAFIGTSAYTGVAGQLRYVVSGSDTVIAGDINGDGVSDFNIVLSNVGSLQASDFVL